MISFAPLVEAKEFYVVWSRKDNACDVTAKKPADQSRVLGTYPTKEQAKAEQDKMPKCRQPKAQWQTTAAAGGSGNFEYRRIDCRTDS